MTDKGVFCLEPIDILMSSIDSRVSIDLHLIIHDEAASAEGQGYTISGFPGVLADAEFMQTNGQLFP